jgi:hypothetical protein
MKHIEKNYNFKNYQERWLELIEDITERLGSWETRKGYKSWELLEAL